MKKNYLIPFAECIYLNSNSVLMSSPEGSLGELHEEPIISNTISDCSDL